MIFVETTDWTPKALAQIERFITRSIDPMSEREYFFLVRHNLINHFQKGA